MPSWALVVSLGPVDPFITSGRRSRDLWWGSTWVSLCTAAAARSLIEEASAHRAGAKVLVPSEDRLNKVEGLLAAGLATFGGRVSNYLEAEVTAASVRAVEALAGCCEAAARSFLAKQLRAAVSGARMEAKRKSSLEHVLDKDAFERQVQAIEEGDFLEVFCAWSPCSTDYSAALDRAWELLNARKSARLFEPASWSRPGRAKSDLDPGRDSVLKTANTADRRESGPVASRRHLARRTLGIGSDEELDALGVARRLALFDPQPKLGRLPFPPLTRVAVDPWLARAKRTEDGAKALKAVREILDREEVQDNPLFFAWCSPARDPDKLFENRRGRLENHDFPYDASVLIEGALPALEKELELLTNRIAPGREDVALSDLTEARRYLRELREPVARLHAAAGTPSPYFALVFMDGDGVGQVLREAEGVDEKQILVEALDNYAARVEGVVRAHHGCAFFVGGDDLAAYLPVDKVLPALAALGVAFRPVQARLGEKGCTSLSAGVVIAHAKADLRALRRRGRQALAEAKAARRVAIEPGRATTAVGFLSICELPRSGNERVATGPLEALRKDLEEWAICYRAGALSVKSGVLLKELGARLRDRTQEGGDRGLELARYRVLAQTERSGKKAPRLLEKLSGEDCTCWREVEGVADGLAIGLRLFRARELRGEEIGKEVAHGG